MMDADGEKDDLTGEGDQGTYQERATAMLDQIAADQAGSFRGGNRHRHIFSRFTKQPRHSDIWHTHRPAG
jgi:hypothetical protein